MLANPRLPVCLRCGQLNPLAGGNYGSEGHCYACGHDAAKARRKEMMPQSIAPPQANASAMDGARWAS